MNIVNDSLHQPHTIQQKPNCSFKSLKPLALLTILILIVLVAGTGGYLLGTRNKQLVFPPQPGTTITQFPPVTIQQPTSFLTPSISNPSTTPSPIPTTSPEIDTSDWKTYTSPQGYSIRYPSYMEHEEPDGYPFDLRIKSDDFIMTFILQTLPNDKRIEEYVTNPLCDDRPNEIKTEKINNVIIYRAEKKLSDNKLCLIAVTGLNTFLINPSQPKSQWVLYIQSLSINRYSAKLFNDILSTLRLT